MSLKPDLSVTIRGITFKNPVTVASGTFGNTDEFEPYVNFSRLGAFVTKTITLRPRVGNPMPRIVETPSGMLNAIGLENKGLEDYVENKIPYLAKFNTRLITSIASSNTQEFLDMVKVLDRQAAISAIELNLSCPNIRDQGIRFAQHAQEVGDIVKAVRGATAKLIFTKLSPEMANFMDIAEISVKSGTDALSVINTIKGMSVDIHRRVPRISNVTGGLSGPAIRPIALRYVYEVKRNLDIPVIGMGGISTWQDAMEFIITGAHMVATGTSNFVNPRASLDVLEGIERYLTEKKIESIQSIRGTLKDAYGKKEKSSCSPS
ncbi:MAG: dihydroorotate dehydrogenase [Candidatus Omnitrophica bacterium]|nr:dihydroorotate dehydrogenase [Candidatus Omnitrophota bacterium]